MISFGIILCLTAKQIHQLPPKHGAHQEVEDTVDAGVDNNA